MLHITYCILHVTYYTFHITYYTHTHTHVYYIFHIHISFWQPVWRRQSCAKISTICDRAWWARAQAGTAAVPSLRCARSVDASRSEASTE